MKRTSPLLATFALVACATVPVVVDSPTAGLGKIATVGTLRVRPMQIVEDSRCPINARCVWAGRLVLRAEARGASGREVRDLTLGEPITIQGTSLALVSVEPAKMAGTVGKPIPYRFTFVGGR
ncbi:MAG TPA: hypothetical protein VNI79_08745 [Sphingomicrobium sp.]|nr:hypothetical protein [Sphingomicrobium sp.]